MTSIFLDRNLTELPTSSRRQLSIGSKPSEGPDVNKTLIVNLSPIKPVPADEVAGKKNKGQGHKVLKHTQFKEVRRKLAFSDAEMDGWNPDKLDFTEKMAAFRTLLKQDAARESARRKDRGGPGSVTSSMNSQVGSVSDYHAIQNGEIPREVKDRLPRAREARRILSKLADEELAKMSLLNMEAQLYLNKHRGKESHQETIERFSGKLKEFVKNTKTEVEEEGNTNSNAREDFLAKFLHSESKQNERSRKGEGQRLSSKKSSKKSEGGGNHDSDSDLDKIPQKESDSQKACSCDIDLKCQKHRLVPRAMSEAGSSVVEGPGSVRRAANRSIQSNVPHYHPSFPTPKDPPQELLLSSKGVDQEGLCKGVRTGEVVITKTGAGSSKHGQGPQTNVKDKGYLTLEDLADRGKARTRRKRTPDKRGGRSVEKQIRKNIDELKRDLEISDSSKENSPSLRRKLRSRGVQYEHDDGVLCIEELTSSQTQGKNAEGAGEVPRTEGEDQGQRPGRVFGPRYPESERGRRRRGQGSDVASRISSASSLASTSSTVMAVELLRKLYNVEDPQTRQDLILKAKCFRRWLQNVQTMQSIDEHGLDDFPDPLSETVKESYVPGVARQGRHGNSDHHGNMFAHLLESDSETAAAFNHFSSVSAQQGLHTGLVEKRKREPLFQAEDIKERATSKVAPITVENLEKHERCQSNVPLHSNLANFVNQTSRSAFERVKPNRPGSVGTDFTRSENLVHVQDGLRLGTGMRVGHTIKRTVKTGSTYQQPPVPPGGSTGISKSVIDKARIARGLGRATNVVPPSIAENLQLLNTANYGVCLQSAEVFYRKRLLSTFFQQWKRRAAEQALLKAAETLHRHHTLKKGMEAFKWAINRSRIFIDIFQSKMRGMSMSMTFYKWRDSAMQNRYQRMRTSFTKWQLFTAEAQKVRSLRETAEQRLVSRTFLSWVEALRMRLKENAAASHFRNHLLTQTLMAWRMFTLESKEKQRRNELARTVHSDRLQRKMFTEMVAVYRKYTKAKKYHRIHHQRQVFLSWHQAARVCKTERDRNMECSKAHWETTTLTRYFIHWHETVLTEKARHAASQRLVRNAFLIWHAKWEYNVQYREEVEAKIRHDILLSTLTNWRENVQVLRKRREAAVVFLQRVLVRHSLHGWNSYTKKKRRLGAILTTFTKQRNSKIQQKYLTVWRNVFEDKLDLQRAKTFWSNTCVRKAVVRWKDLCHQRLLQRLLHSSEPNRQRHLLRVMFQRWMDAKKTMETEKQEALESRTVLQKSQLKRYFLIWKSEAELRFRIQPMVEKRLRMLLSQSFCDWHELVQHKKQCRNNSDVFRRRQLQTLFNAWRHQYQLHQIEKTLHQSVLRNQLQRCIQGWRSVIKRKHAAHQFHDRQLLQQTFDYWRDKAVTQLGERVAAKEIQEWHTSLLREHFNLWRENALTQCTYREGVVQSMEERRAARGISAAFTTWRTLFRATLVARENTKLLTRKLQERVLLSWHNYTQRALRRAVYDFALRLRLEPPDEGSFSTHNSTTDTGDEETDKCHMIQDLVDVESTSGIHSPYISSTTGTPHIKLFSPALSRVSLDLDRSMPEIDNKPSMINTSFIDARFEMEQAVKTERLKEIVTTVIKRLRFWPISTAFDQWREYTIQQRELRYSLEQLTKRVQELQLSMMFREWRSNYIHSARAKTFRESSLKRKTLEALYLHSRKMKYKKQLSALAYKYRSLNVYKKVFPMWYDKAHDKKHREEVVRLWTTETEEERLLVPVETEVRGRIQHRTVAKCFSLWQLKFMRIHKIKVAYNRIILKRCMESWHELASLRHEQKTKCDTFNRKRLQKQAFKTWCVRRSQQVLVKERYRVVQNQRLKDMFIAWHQWTIGSKQRRIAGDQVMVLTQQHLVVKSFLTWRCEFVKLQQVRKWCEQRMMMRIIYEWHQVAQHQKSIRQKVLKFKVTSYTRLVIRMYKVWHTRYLERLQQHEEHEKTVQRRALQLGIVWKRKAQKSRGQKLQHIFLQRQVQSCFAKWKYSYERNMERENQLRKYVTRKNRNLMGQYLDAWKTTLLANQAGRHFNSKLLKTLFTEWHRFAAASQRRVIICSVYIKAAEQRTLKSYFHYWRSLSQVQMDIRKHCDLKVQIRVLREWHVYAKRRRQLRVLGQLMEQHVNLRIVRNVWYTMRQQADYYQSLNETATKIVQEKNRLCMTKALTRWRDHLNHVIAGQCYHHLLARRVARQWHRFVAAQKAERQRVWELNQMATKLFNKTVCSKAFRALHNEVKVKRQLQRHKDRLSNKYGRLWKLRVDLMYTAICVNNENMMLKAWKTWRVEVAKIQASHKVSAYNDRKIITQVFIAWKGLTFKKLNQSRMKTVPSVSSIPVPVPPSQPSGLDPAGYRGSMIPTPMNGSVGRYTRTQRKS